LKSEEETPIDRTCVRWRANLELSQKVLDKCHKVSQVLGDNAYTHFELTYGANKSPEAMFSGFRRRDVRKN